MRSIAGGQDPRQLNLTRGEAVVGGGATTAEADTPRVPALRPGMAGWGHAVRVTKQGRVTSRNRLPVLPRRTNTANAVSRES